MLGAVIFDIGGVLELTPPTGHSAEWEVELGLPPGAILEQLADVWRGGSIGTLTEVQVHQALRERLGLSEADLDRFMAGVWDEYLGTPNTELIAWFGGLRPRYRTGIVSNSFVGARERESERYGFDALADVLVYSHEVGLAKPDPAIYLLACAQLDVRPEEAVFLDDVPASVEAARELGISGVVFQDNAQAIAELEELLTRRSEG